MTNDWAFGIDPNHWLPLPPAEKLDDARKAVWLERATALAARANLAELPEIEVLRERCREILESADAREACVFFPVMEGGPVRVEMATLPVGEWQGQLDHWQRRDDETRNWDSTPYEHQAFGEAQRIMRVDDSPSGAVLFSVAFLGHDDARLFLLSLTTENPLVAGQFGAMAQPFFMSVRALDPSVHG